MIERAATAVVALVLTGAGCSGDTHGDRAGDTSEAATTASEAVAVEASESSAVTYPDGDPAGLSGAALEEYVARRYEAYWDAYDEARATPSSDPAADFPILLDLAAGEQLEISYESLAELAAKGEAIREPEIPAIAGTEADAEHRVEVEMVDDSLAEISACVVNDDVRHIVGTGAVVRDSVSTVASEATMAFTDGDWKLIRSRAVEIAEGVTGCWLTDDADYPY